MESIPLKWGLTALVIVAVPVLRAYVSVAPIFGDHMVLQQDAKLSVWGTAARGEKVTVSIGEREAQANADARGNWTVNLPPLPVTDQPEELTVTGVNKLVFKDVLVGDVWLCSGQSNMAFGVGNAYNASETIAKADYPQIRLFIVQQQIAYMPKRECNGKWLVCTPANVAEGGWNGFSAVGYFFGRDLYETYKKPIGLIGAYWNGTPAQAWTSLETLQANPMLAHYATTFAEIKDTVPSLKQQYDKEMLPKWQREAAAWKASPTHAGPLPKRPPSPENASEPTVLYNGMIAPLISYGIKGVIWYQGERNAWTEGDATEYATLFPALISDWRQHFGEENFPFIFVQLANFMDPRTLQGQFWPILRNAQLRALALPNTGMAVTIDIGEGNNLHPRDKIDVGHRLALPARHLAYGEDIVYSGPIYKSMAVRENKIILCFRNVGSGMIIGSPPPIWLDQQPLSPADHLNAFEIAGANNKFVAAQAKIEGETVEVWSNEVAEPKAVRYAWSGNPNPSANLYNKEGLPASPFSTE